MGSVRVLIPLTRGVARPVCVNVEHGPAGSPSFANA